MAAMRVRRLHQKEQHNKTFAVCLPRKLSVGTATATAQPHATATSGLLLHYSALAGACPPLPEPAGSAPLLLWRPWPLRQALAVVGCVQCGAWGPALLLLRVLLRAPALLSCCVPWPLHRTFSPSIPDGPCFSPVPRPLPTSPCFPSIPFTSFHRPSFLRPTTNQLIEPHLSPPSAPFAPHQRLR